MSTMFFFGIDLTNPTTKCITIRYSSPCRGWFLCGSEKSSSRGRVRETACIQADMFIPVRDACFACPWGRILHDAADRDMCSAIMIIPERTMERKEKVGGLGRRKTYMDFWDFTEDEKNKLIRRLTDELPALRGAVQASQDEIARAIGVSRQTYCAVETRKRKMSWNNYMALILFFDYNPNSHYTIRKLNAFPSMLDECWLAGKMDQASGEDK